MIDALTQEHERTVSAARISLIVHDSGKPLIRWFDNYKDDKDAILWSHRWSVVTRDGRRWKVETGLPDSTDPTATYTIDPRAPEPPIFEFRPPPAEPVKPRFNVSPPPRMPSAMEYIMGQLSYYEQEELRRRLRERQRRRPVFRPSFIGVDWARGYGPIESMEFEVEDEPIGERELFDLAHAIMDRRFRYRPPPVPQPVRPPPAPTRRNQ